MSFRSVSPATSAPSATLSSFPDVVKESADVAMATGSACAHARSCCLDDLAYTSARGKVGH